MSSGTVKRIFISDIHMGDERSVSQGHEFHNYCWFYDARLGAGPDRPGMLAEFLQNYCIGDDSVAEVVVAGDLFDEWVCPVQFDPTEPPHPVDLPHGEQYRKIARAHQNRPVIEALKTLASQKRLVYVPGNHDMCADKPIVEEIFPDIRCPDPVDGHYVYYADGIWAEHGHWYGMFNGPYLAASGGGFAGSLLPLGYFITRINAEEALRTGKMLGLSQVLKEWLDHIRKRAPNAKDQKGAVGDLVDKVIMDLFETLVSDHAYGQEGVVMNGFSGIPGRLKWQEIEDRYAHVWSTWPDIHPHNVNRIEAMESDAGSLAAAANLITFQHEKARIVICGHTHTSDLISFDHSPYPPDEYHPEEKRVYANAGAWTNDKPTCTFVETELRPQEGKHLVCIRKWVKDSSGKGYKAEDVPPDGWVVADGSQ